MGYLKPIKRNSQQDNTGGLVQISICRKVEVESIPAPSGRTVYGNIVLKAGASFVRWDVPIARMQSRGSDTRDGGSMSNVLNFAVPKDRSDLREMFNTMIDDEFIVVYIENGRQKVFGLLHTPARFGFSHDTGGDIGDLNASACNFFYAGPDNIYFYDGTISTAPSGPAPSIIRFNGQVIGSLQPGETFNITSEFGFTNFYTSS